MELLRLAASILRKIPGSLVLIPLAVLAVGTEYSCAAGETIGAGLVSDTSADGSPSSPAEFVSLRFESEGADLATGTRLGDGEHLLARLPAAMTAFILEVQADCCNAYDVSGITPGGQSIDLETIPAVRGVAGLRSRTVEINTDTPVGVLRIAPVQGGGPYVVSAVRVSTNAALSHAAIAYVAWALFLVLVAVTRLAPRAGRRLLDAWARADALLVAVIIPTLVFRPTPTVLAIAGTVATLAAITVALRRAFLRLTYPVLLYNGLVIVLALWLGPRILAAVIEQSIFHEYEQTIDHRMKPDGGEVNSDSIRFRGEAGSIDVEDFNVVFLGDSFIYGMGLEYETTVPYLIESSLAFRKCEQRVRAVNFGWVSSSPLLSFRLLRDIGHKYHPDLVVYMLDMTDFFDDLHFERRFIQRQGPQVLPAAVVSELIERAALAVFDRNELREIVANVRTATERESISVPAQRFYVTNQPIEESVTYIERGVMKNLGFIDDYATNVLRASMVLVVAPRAYQYTDRESPDNWEAGWYDPLGPHVLAPFDYFERKQRELPYGVFSLLPAFRQAPEFPLYFRDDPHWNPAGARVAARAIADYLVTQGAVPCGG